MKGILGLVVVSLMLCNCAGIWKELTKENPYEPARYAGQKEIYPAVLQVISNHGFRLKSMSILKNEYETDYGIVQGLYKTRFKVFVKEDTVHVNVMDILTYYEAEKRWVDGFLSAGLSRNILGSHISQEIVGIMQNDSLYQRIQDELYSNFEFNLAVMNDMTAVARESWVEKIKNHRFTWKFNMTNCEKNTEFKSESYKYLVTFRYNIDETRYFMLNNIFINLYTNDPKYIKNKPHELAEGSGRLVKLEQPKLMPDCYVFSLVE